MDITLPILQLQPKYRSLACELRIYSLFFYKNLLYKKHRGSNFQISRISNLISIVKLISVCLFTFLQESILQGSPRLKFPNIKNTLKLKISSTPYPALKMTLSRTQPQTFLFGRSLVSYSCLSIGRSVYVPQIPGCKIVEHLMYTLFSL